MPRRTLLAATSKQAMFSSKWKYSGRKLCRLVSSRRIKEEIKIPEGKKITEPWNERKGFWKSTFKHFEPKVQMIGPDIIRLMQTPLDFSPGNVRKWYENRVQETEEATQAFDAERYRILGADLAAAHFVVHRGGAVRFKGDKEWTKSKSDGSYTLPTKYVAGLYIEAIDCSEMVLRHQGLDNILDLQSLRWLSLANNDLVDDWTLDSISGSYGETLQYLDLSNCPKISYRGLSCFYRFKKLDTLVVNGIANSDEFKLACMMLEDLKPMLTIKGIEHILNNSE